MKGERMEGRKEGRKEGREGHVLLFPLQKEF
jgi:hypothetical protein